jgi:hypothetical protein
MTERRGEEMKGEGRGSGTRKEANRERTIHAFSGNNWRSSKNSDAIYFCSFYGLMLLIMVAGRCL